MKKKVCIVHYNTPELTRAAIKSIRKHGGEDYSVVVFDNSDKRPFGKMDGVRVLDNTKGQIIDFDKELSLYKKNPSIGVAFGCNYGSAKHMMSIEWLINNSKDPFVLCDSDILIRQSIDTFFDEEMLTIGKRGCHGGMAKERILPMLCWINVPMFWEKGIHYFDPERSWALWPEHDDPRNWYDTGASLLEDVRTKDLPWREVDINEYMYHLGSASWREGDTTAEQWLEHNRDLWDETPYERGIKEVAMCAIVRMENHYLRDWIQWYWNLGVSKFFIYDNSRPADPERPAELLADHIAAGTVEVLPWKMYEGNVQCPAYDDCYRKHGREYAWIGFLDIDELVHIKDGGSLPDLLNRHSKTADVVVMHWRMMGDSGLTHYDPRPLWERFTQPSVQKWPEMCRCKSFVRGGIAEMSFGADMHCPLHPTLRVVNPNGTLSQQKSISDKDEKSVAWIDHYFTKTAEEYVWKMQRGFPVWTWHNEKKLATAVNYFFDWNEKTDEKVAILKLFNDNLPNSIRIMEHLTKKNARWGYTQLIADPGYIIRSKNTGAVFTEITVPNPDAYEVIPLPISSTAKTVKKSVGKPKTEK